MHTVGFEHTIPGFELAKTVRALDRGATVIDIGHLINSVNSFVIGLVLLSCCVVRNNHDNIDMF
jgi:hypothetical protein